MSERDQPYVHRWLTANDGLRLHLRDYPGPVDRLPLLCLHGLTRNARDFEELAELHSPGRRVILVDFRGRGGSDFDPQPERYNPLTYANDVIRIMDHLGFAEAIFVGTSLGGLVTMVVAVMEPDRIAATILNDVGPDLEQAGLERLRTYVGKDERFATWDEAAKAAGANSRFLPASHGSEDWLRIARKQCREDGGSIRFDYDSAIGIPYRDPQSDLTPTVDLWPMFAKLAEKPVLVLRGELSDLISEEGLRRMADSSPNVTAVTVPGVGHSPMLDEPDAVAAIAAFVDAVPDPARHD